MAFYNRKKELAFLRKKCSSSKAEFIILYGRRRVGKTELLKQIDHDNTVYYLASEETKQNQIESFKKSVESVHPQITDIKNSWKAVLLEAAKHVDVLIIDEFPYVIASHKPILSKLQYVWDEHIQHTDTTIILSGSSIGTMETDVLGYRSPLYGRRTGQWKLNPFLYTDIHHFFPTYTPEQLITTFAVLGGTPYYLSQFDQKKSILQNIKDNILSKGAVLREEVPQLLHQEMRSPKNYFSILKAVAAGKTRFNHIQQATGIQRSSLSKYLSRLQRLDILERRTPVTEQHTKRSIYVIKDMYFQFWFRYVFPYETPIEYGDPWTEHIEATLDKYVSRIFERVCQTYILRHKNVGRVGSWWWKEQEIDVVALNEHTNTIIFGECKWTNQPVGMSEYTTLQKKASHVRWKNKERNEEYYLFSKSGFTKEVEKQDVTCVTPQDMV